MAWAWNTLTRWFITRRSRLKNRKLCPRKPPDTPIKAGPIMNTKGFALGLTLACLVAAAGAADSPAPKENVFATKPLGIRVSIKMDGPYMEAADLQIICLFRHKPTGDTYQGAAKETDARLGSILSALRNRGEFVGELGETILFTPPEGSIPAKQFMIIGLGEEKDLSIDRLRVVGRIAAREAVRLKAKHVAWAPVIRDEGNTAIDVGEGDRAFAEQMLSAYDTEKRLQAQGLAPNFSIETFVIEAGPTFFDGAVKKVGQGIDSVTAELQKRDGTSYASNSKSAMRPGFVLSSAVA